MGSLLESAFVGEAWSLTEVMYGLSEQVDDEGRPLQERRAPTTVREGVPMRMRACPYPGVRRGRAMNVSALEQITRHLDEMLADLAGFRALTPTDSPTWDDVYTAVLDQQLQPALLLLRDGNASAHVPVKAAVGYKIASGYADPVRELLALEDAGQHVPVSVEALLGHVDRRGMLMGRAEACAGPPALVARVTRVLLHGQPDAPPIADPRRLWLARKVAAQSRLGQAWSRFDDLAERTLLAGTIGAHLRPGTQYLRRMLEERREAHRKNAVPSTPVRIPGAVSDDWRPRLLRAVADATEPPADPGPTVAVIERLLARREGAIEISDPSLAGTFARSFASHLAAHLQFREALRSHERELRQELGFPTDAPISLRSVFSPPRAIPWFERILGYRFRESEREPGTFLFRNHLRAVPAGL